MDRGDSSFLARLHVLVDCRRKLRLRLVGGHIRLSRQSHALRSPSARRSDLHRTGRDDERHQRSKRNVVEVWRSRHRTLFLIFKSPWPAARAFRRKLRPFREDTGSFPNTNARPVSRRTGVSQDSELFFRAKVAADLWLLTAGHSRVDRLRADRIFAVFTLIP
jgi:hypothetical protein